MRIEELYLKAFGPFEERVLRFPSDEPGLCIVYGPNEAGKSSALRAIHDLLYGIPENTRDHFRRKPKEMRVGGRLIFDDGESLAFMRRKGRKGTLSAYDAPAQEAGPRAADSARENSNRKPNATEAPIEVPRLDALVASIPESLFKSFYGLDHRELSRGARVLLEDDGELGRALFAAGMGTANLRRLLDELDEEASALFKPRGKNQPLAQSIHEFETMRKAIRKDALRPESFEQAKRELEDLEARTTKLDGEIGSARVERARLDRIRRTLSDLARFRGALERFAELESVKALPEDFEASFRETLQRRSSAAERQAQAEEQIAAAERRRVALDESLGHNLGQVAGLTRAREEITSLIQRVSAYQDEVEQLPRRRADLDRLQIEIDTILASLGMSEQSPEIATLAVSLAGADRVRELSTQRTESAVRGEAAKQELEAARAALDQIQARLDAADPPADTTRLARVVERARKLGDLDEQLAKEGPALEAREAECERSLARLGFWTGSLDEIDRLVFPDLDSIEEFAMRFEKRVHLREALAREEIETQNERRRAREELARLRGEGTVPSEAERDAARRQRNETWRRLRSERGQPLEALEAELPERFETQLAIADEVADRLRQEADRVAREAQLEAQLVGVSVAEEDQADRRRELQVEEDRVRAAWQSLWQPLGIEPGTPTEMRGFTERRRRLLDEVRSTRALRGAWQAREQERERACQAISQELAGFVDADDGVSGSGRPVLERLDDAIAAGEHRLQACAAAAQEALQRRAERKSAQARLDQAIEAGRRLEEGEAAQQSAWERAVAGFGLGDSPSARDAEARLASLEALAHHRSKRDELAERVAKMEANGARFATDVENVLLRCAPDLKGADPGIAVPQLIGRLAEAENQQTITREIDATLEAKREERAAAIRQRDAAEKKIRSLQEEAEVAAEADLESAIEKARLRADAQRQLQEVESRILEVGEGRSISAIEIEAKGVDGDSLGPQIVRLDEEVEQKTEAWKGLLAETLDARRVLDEMDGSANVARLAGESEEVLATISKDAKRYVTLRIARAILAEEIETYRNENQAPVLGRASKLFERLTLGQYAGVQSMMDDADRTELVALMPDDTKKTVDQLSAGTRDQLFLALRLATLEIQVERAEPMPLIADDILVEFDDARSRATLEVLAGLAQKTQILLFSHHRHVLDQAKELGGRVSVVEL